MSRRAVNRDYDDRERSRSRSVSGRGEGRDIRAETLLVSGSQPYWAFRRFRFLARGFRGEKLVESFPTVDFWKIIETGLNRFSDWEFNLPCEIGVGKYLSEISRWYILQGKGFDEDSCRISEVKFLIFLFLFFVLYIISLEIFFITVYVVNNIL